MVVVEGNEKLFVSHGPITRTFSRVMNGLGLSNRSLINEPRTYDSGPVVIEVRMVGKWRAFREMTRLAKVKM